MYTKLIKVLPSSIDGKGVFAEEDIAKDSVVWIFDADHDLRFSREEFEKLTKEEKERFERIAYLSPWSGFWVSPPEDDPAQFTNHSNANNLSVVYNKEISDEPFFIANRDIPRGEELTNNYREFDLITQESKPIWSQ